MLQELGRAPALLLWDRGVHTRTYKQPASEGEVNCWKPHPATSVPQSSLEPLGKRRQSSSLGPLTRSLCRGSRVNQSAMAQRWPLVTAFTP